MWEIRVAEFFYRPNTIFGKVFEAVGEAPALIPFVFGLIIVFNYFIKKKGRICDVYFAIYLMVVVLVTAGVTFLLKNFVGRTRFYDLNAPDYLGYTPFYVKGYGGESFPSGHAAMSALLLLFYDIIKRYKTFKYSGAVLALCIVFTVLVCISRLMQGAHFITDVLVGVVIAFAVRYILKIPFKKLYDKS